MSADPQTLPDTEPAPPDVQAQNTDADAVAQNADADAVAQNADADADADTDAEAEAQDAERPVPGAGRRAVRRALTWTLTALAALLVGLALVTPNRLGQLTPAAFLRLPLEGLLGVVLLVVLPPRARRVAAVIVGAAIGLLLLMKIVDMGFFASLARPFDPVLDWFLLVAAVEVVRDSLGRAGAIGAVVVAVVLAVAVLVLMIMSVLRLSRLGAQHRTGVVGTVAVLGAAWVACAVLGVQIVPGVPVAAHESGRVIQLRDGLADHRAFAEESAVDAFRDTPGEQLLTDLRGKDVIIAFVESYGRDAVTDPEFAPHVGAVLADGDTRLRAAGFESRSAYLTSPVMGGNSWLAHATLLCGLWIHNQQRYRTLLDSDRLTLNAAFQRADWRTVGVMPGVIMDWPEGEFYGYDQVYANEDLGYEGPRVNFAKVPDQYTMSVFERRERARRDRPPVMAEIPLVSSHAPWTPMPSLIGWDEIDNGPAFEEMSQDGHPPEAILGDTALARTEYRRTIEYTLSVLISYVETYGDENLVLVFLGDHQPAPRVIGDGASWDVPITIVAGDPAVLDQIADWGWDDGLMPGPDAPVTGMETFRDRFLTAYGSTPTA